MPEIARAAAVVVGVEAEVVGPEARKILRHTNCSVLILRNRSGE